MSLISIIVPMFNEEVAIADFFAEVQPIMAGLDVDYEIICINDGSRDGTEVQLHAVYQQYPDIVRVLNLSRNFGKETALTAGLDIARGDAVIPIDVDLQDPPELIATLIAKWREGFEVVHAVRTSRAGDHWLKRMTARGFYWLIGHMTDVDIPANAGDFRLLDRQVVDVICRMRERDRFMKGLFVWPGFRQTNIGFTRRSRARGETKFGYWRLWNFALSGITGFSTIPLRAWTYGGFAVSMLSFFYAAYLVIRTLVSGVDVPGYASLMVTLLFFSGLQITGIGILGEYIGRIHGEVKRRPLYVVASYLGPKRPLPDKPEISFPDAVVPLPPDG